MRQGTPVALTIAGSDSCGGAGIQADLRAFAVVGVHGASVVTAVTAQDSLGVRSVHPVPATEVDAQLEVVARDLRPRWAKTGMLHDPQVVRVVAGRLAEHGIAHVVDPLVAASSGEALGERGLLEAIQHDLLPHTSLLVPNVVEASMLLRGRRILTEREAHMAAEDLRELGPTAVLLKGGHLEGTTDVVDVLCTGRGRFEVFRHPRMPGTFHGTGCALSALVTAYMARGDPLERAVTRGERVLQTMMASAYPVGSGALCLDHMAPLRLAGLRWEVARQVRLAARQLEMALTDEWLPEVGTNVVFALPGATSADEVAALTGRIHRVCRHARVTGHVNFGASRYMATVVLAAMMVDPDVRAAVNIRRTDDHLRRAREAGLVVASFERDAEPAHAPKDLEWGTMEAIRRTGSVPDVVEDTGGLRMEPQMRVLGRDPAEVVDKVRRILAKE